jgi:hypothetical protein
MYSNWRDNGRMRQAGHRFATDCEVSGIVGLLRSVWDVSNDDVTAMAELRFCVKAPGFKSKQMTSIFSLPIAILELGTLQPTEVVSSEDIAHVAN